VDLEAYVQRHQPEWDRLRTLVSHRRRLTGAEADELVTLYQRVATHLSVIRSSAPDPVLVGRLSTLVAQGRSAVTGAHVPAWRDLSRFFTAGFPAALYRTAPWWATIGVIFVITSTLIGWWIATHPRVQNAIAPPESVQQLVEHDFADYYSNQPAEQFAFGIWTNNAWVAATCLVLGVALGLPVIYILWQNAVNIAVTGGFMAAYDRLDIFFGLLTPHGLLEITAVFVAAGAGMRLGWTVVFPGGRTRGQALAEVGRSTVAMALGLAVVLAISGVIEAFVTPSPLPTWARVGIGVVAEVAFLTYVFVVGRRAVRAGESGDVTESERGDVLPVAG
jgi:uncharacterized membrane protein SpoIIM required for sporulation